MTVVFVLGIFIAVIFGKAGVELVKGLIALALGSLLLMASCAIV